MSQQPSDALHDPTTSDGGLGISDYPPPSADKQATVDYALTVNGTELVVTDAWIGESLLYALRERLGLPGSKNACEQGECGSCSALLDGRLVATCCVLAADAVGSEIRTVEGLAPEDELTDVQRAFVEQGAVQCGFCIPGMVVAIHDLLDRSVRATELELREAISGNLCRCTGYGRIFAAFRQAQEGRINAGA
jgi:aerobic-type carbon monoxide dehydrogenase small subunit (CoxS/CutS family)